LIIEKALDASPDDLLLQHQKANRIAEKIADKSQVVKHKGKR
jgi:hypothetical protein